MRAGQAALVLFVVPAVLAHRATALSRMSCQMWVRTGHPGRFAEKQGRDLCQRGKLARAKRSPANSNCLRPLSLALPQGKEAQQLPLRE